MDRLDQTPLWIIGVACVIALIIAHEFGYRTGRFVPEDGHSDARGYLVSSAVSLSSLMMAFTFGAAQTDFKLRQTLVADEASAIATAYLRVQTLEQPWLGQLSRSLLDYARVRGAFYRATDDRAELSRNDADTRRHQAHIWAAVRDVVRTNPPPSLSAPLVQAVNEMFVSADLRIAAQDVRVPPAVLLMLTVAGLASAALVGFVGSGKRRYAVILSAVLFIKVLAFCLILALDRPDSATVSVSQRPMDRVIAEIARSQASGETRR